MIILSIYIFISFWANIDFAEGRFLLFMDELISYDQTLRIISSQSVNDFVFEFFDGNEYRYGRIMYWIMSFISFLPYFLWGETGLIVSNRMVLVLMTVLTYIVTFKLLYSIFKDTRIKYFLLVLLLIPNVPYFSSMPKPEPFLLFFLMLFIFFYWKANFRSGYHFILLGIVYSLKISALPYVFVTIIFSMFLSIIKNKKKWFKETIFSIGMFLFGFIIGTPYFLMTLTGDYSYIDNYIIWTYKNTGHGSDNNQTTYKNWFHQINQSWSYLFSGSFFIIPIFSIFIFLKKNPVSSMFKTKKQLFFLYVFISSLSFLIPIFLFVKRVWLFYLYIGLFLLFLFSILVLYEYIISDKKLNLELKYGYVLIYIISIILLIPINLKEYNELSLRSQSSSHFIRYEKYLAIIKYISTLPINNYLIYYDPLLYSIRGKFHHIEIIEFWGPFVQWDSNPDFIILDSNYSYIDEYIQNQTRSNYQTKDRSKKIFKNHVFKKWENPIYEISHHSGNGLTILKLVQP